MRICCNRTNMRVRFMDVGSRVEVEAFLGPEESRAIVFRIRVA